MSHGMSSVLSSYHPSFPQLSKDTLLSCSEDTWERQAPGTQVTSILHLAMRGELAEAKIFYVTLLRHKEELAYLGEHKRL